MPYRKIVAAYDGSEQSIRALKTAMELASCLKASLEVIHAYKMPVMVIGEAMVPPSAAAALSASDEADNLAAEVRSIVSAAPGIDAEVTVVQGEFGERILSEAESKGADLIVIGSRGKSGLKELFLGSVSHYILQHAKIAVHVVK